MGWNLPPTTRIEFSRVSKSCKEEWNGVGFVFSFFLSFYEIIIINKEYCVFGIRFGFVFVWCNNTQETEVMLEGRKKREMCAVVTDTKPWLNHGDEGGRDEIDPPKINNSFPRRLSLYLPIHTSYTKCSNPSSPSITKNPLIDLILIFFFFLQFVGLDFFKTNINWFLSFSFGQYLNYRVHLSIK